MAKMVTVRSVIAVAASKHWHIYQMDVYNAFLQGDLFEDVHMQLLQGYNIKGESRNKRGSALVVILVYVDDLLVTGNDPSLIQSARENLQKKFKMKDLGELRFFLGIEFACSKAGILMNQRKYALDLIADSGLGGAKPASIPLECNQRLTTAKFDEVVLGSEDVTNAGVKDNVLPDPEPYQRLVGKLLYLTMTRPDIAYVVLVLSQFMHKPKRSHMDAALRVIRYVKNAPGLGLLMPSQQSKSLVAFCDSDWASCPQSRKSVTGYLVKFGNSLISWKSKKQNTVSRSSAEVEFRSMASTVAEVSWLVGLFKELGIQIQLPIPLHCDSKTAIQIVANLIFHERTKHIDIDCHFV
ncbi:uncharacterized mitochondrial protein AtMg00810-like [Nicotiana sylvestris]|uniref:uncharacterized mitochondrial protein AtMg00810-like n=1 Tax=Nicotiana sylvestris TaxID=4096 RepID=UPI00388CB577